MKSIHHSGHNGNLTHIETLEDLQAEIRKVKTGLKTQEKELEERWDRLPRETFKSTAGAVIPFVIDSVIAARTFGIVKGATGIIFGSLLKGKGDLKKNLLIGAKKIGVLTMLKAASGLFKKK
ncbi:MAG: hypothetical protein ABJA71_15700 [Ginsengibacter sp.]